MAAQQMKRASQAIFRQGLKSIARRTGMPLIKPWWVVLDITDRCFFRCPTCAKWQVPPQREELSTIEWQQILERLGRWLGGWHVSLTGGEPLLRPDIPELVAWARWQGATTNLMTNGYLIDEALATRLAAAGLDSVTVSLNGITAETHDRSRGFPGSLARARRALQILQACGTMQVSISAILDGENAEQVPALVKWAQAEGIAGVGIQLRMPTFAFQSHDRTVPRDSWPVERSGTVAQGDPVALIRAIDRLREMKSEGYPIVSSEDQLRATRAYLQHGGAEAAAGCRAGFDNILIDPYGQVRICNQMAPLGNVGEVALQELWFSSLAQAQRMHISRCQEPCRLLFCNADEPLWVRAKRFMGRLRARKEAPRGNR